MNGSLTDKTVKEFCDLLSSKAAVPGGGGAAALGGAMGIGLGNMVASLTLGKKKYAEYQAEIESLLAEGMALQSALLALVDGDAAAFAPLAAAYGLPTETPAQQESKRQALSAASRTAAEAPLEIARKVGQALHMVRRIGEIGSILAVSDAACAALFLQAAFHSACYNVRINLPAIAEGDYVAAVEAELAALQPEVERLTTETLAVVDRRMKK